MPQAAAYASTTTAATATRPTNPARPPTADRALTTRPWPERSLGPWSPSPPSEVTASQGNITLSEQVLAIPYAFRSNNPLTDFPK